MVKKSIVIALVVLLLLLSACGNADNTAQPNNTTDSNVNTKNNAEPDPTAPPADPLGKYEQPVTMTVGTCIEPTDETLPAGDTIEDNVFTRSIREDLNIDVKVYWSVSCGTNRNQKVSLAIASNDLPDAMVVTAVELRQMADADQLESLAAAYEMYAGDGVRGVIESTEGLALQSATFDGKLLAFPSVTSRSDGTHLMWIRQDWLDKLNMDPPKTIDDLEKVALAFKNDDPDGNNQADTFAITGPQTGGHLSSGFLRSTNNPFGFDPVFSAFKAHPGHWVEGPDGKAIYGSILPETKEALAKLRDWYSKGLIDPEMGIRKQASEPIVAGRSGIFFGMWWAGFTPIPDAIKENPKASWQAYALPLDNEGQFNPHINTPSTRFVVVRKGYKHPEAVVKIQNWLYLNEDRIEAESGVHTSNIPIRITLDRFDKFEGEVDLLQKVLFDGASTDTLKPENQPFNPTLMAEYENALKVKKEPYDNNNIEYWDVEADGGVFPRTYARLVGGKALLGPMNRVSSLIYSQTKTMESRWVNLEKLEEETFMKIIMGVEPVDSFDQFVSDWKNQGGDTITSEVQATLE